MSAPTRSRFRSSAMILGAAVLMAGAFLATDAPPAAAQGFGWFGGILGGGTPQRSPAPAYPGYRSGDDTGGGYDDGSARRRHRRDYGGDPDDAPRRHTQRRKHPDAAPAVATQQKPKTLKPTATVFVDVFGDGFGTLLASGLEEAMADRPEVGIVSKARGSSGLVATYFYDWPKAIDDYLAERVKTDKPSDKADTTEAGKAANAEKSKKDTGKAAGDKPDGKKQERERIDVAVMMVGSNDRQPITKDGKTYARGSDEWNAIYRKRVLSIAEAFQKRKIPLIWVGLPITKDDDFADDMAALNEVYKDVAAKTGAVYVDSWEVFSDDKGDFAAFGPDINGQTVRLRTTEGIYFTHAGARKLAHFVEAHIRRDLDGKIPVPQLPTAESPAIGDKGAKGKADPDKKTPSVAMIKPEAGPIKNLGEAPVAKDGMLLQVPTSSEAIVAVKDRQEAAPAGRADNFRWPQPTAASTEMSDKAKR